MTAGGLGQLVASPTDLIKTQIQMEGRRRLQGKPPRVHGTTDAFKKIVAANGLAGSDLFNEVQSACPRGIAQWIKHSPAIHAAGVRTRI